MGNVFPDSYCSLSVLALTAKVLGCRNNCLLHIIYLSNRDSFGFFGFGFLGFFFFHRMTEWLRLEVTPGDHLVQLSLLKQDHLDLHALDHVQMVSFK